MQEPGFIDEWMKNRIKLHVLKEHHVTIPHPFNVSYHVLITSPSSARFIWAISLVFFLCKTTIITLILIGWNMKVCSSFIVSLGSLYMISSFQTQKNATYQNTLLWPQYALFEQIPFIDAELSHSFVKTSKCNLRELSPMAILLFYSCRL